MEPPSEGHRTHGPVAWHRPSVSRRLRGRIGSGTDLDREHQIEHLALLAERHGHADRAGALGDLGEALRRERA